MKGMSIGKSVRINNQQHGWHLHKRGLGDFRVIRFLLTKYVHIRTCVYLYTEHVSAFRSLSSFQFVSLKTLRLYESCNVFP